jgi:Tfp pilus assembly protein PilN
MLVEINLLPQKERAKKGFLLTLSGMLVLFLMLGGFYFWQIQSVKTDIANLDKQITMTKKITEAEQTNGQSNESAMSVSLLKNAVEWANSYPIQTIPVMQHLTSLLPERGFIQSFGYTEAGTVTLSVQFDSAREAAYFLDSLHGSEWIEEASLSSLNAEEKETQEKATQTTEPSDTSDQQNEVTPTNTNVGVVVTPDPNNPGNFIITPVNPTEGSTVPKETKLKDNYLPRYMGQFEITFNKETIKELTKDDGEGVTNP